MKMLSNLVSEIGDVIDSLTLSSKEKMQLRANLTEVLSRFEADLQREQSSVIRSESQGNWLQRSWRPIVMLVFPLSCYWGYSPRFLCLIMVPVSGICWRSG